MGDKNPMLAALDSVVNAMADENKASLRQRSVDERRAFKSGREKGLMDAGAISVLERLAKAFEAK